jgi:HEAT repeat protein
LIYCAKIIMTKKNKINVDPKDIKALKAEVLKLEKTSPKKLNDAICDIIDLGGYSIAVMLDKMKDLPPKIQLAVAHKLEDFIYFHPEKGAKILERFKKNITKVEPACRPHLFACLVDIAEALGAELEDDTPKELLDLSDLAVDIINEKPDLMRATKAIDIIAKSGRIEALGGIIKLMISSLGELDKYQNYLFIETSLLAVKRLGGEAVLRLLINPNSEGALRQLKLENRELKEPLLTEILDSMKVIDDNFAQVVLKIVDLSEFNLPFMPMINEGLSHPDKWVRQVAAEAMQKATEGFDLESLTRLLTDSADEVRLMAITSLGSFEASKTGYLLENLALKDSETVDIRLNAIYALYSQKNLEALTSVYRQTDNASLSVNAAGLMALLMPHAKGVTLLLELFVRLKETLLAELLYYFNELVLPEDLSIIASFYSAQEASGRERLMQLIGFVVEKKAGPRLEAALAKLPAQEQEALRLLMKKELKTKKAGV